MAQTHQGGQFYISSTTISDVAIPLDQTAFEALTWVEVEGVVSAPGFQITDNILTQNTLSDDIADKQKGFRMVEDTEVICSYREGATGQAAVQAAARNKNSYAIKYELDNSAGTNGTTQYAVAVIGGGGLTGGEGEDFVNRVFSVAPKLQFPVEVDAA